MKNETLFNRLYDICEPVLDALDIEADRETRDAMTRPAVRKFWDKYGKHVSPSFLDYLEDINWHTERRLIIEIFKEKYH
jgi:hypothetical protein